jgi:lysophospholipase L1-like esterase
MTIRPGFRVARGLDSLEPEAMHVGVKLPLLLPLMLGLHLPLHAADQVVTLGDSLTYGYEGEFCFRITVPPAAGSSAGTYGDNMPATVRNWIETLSSTNYRNAYFDQGARVTFRLNFALLGGNNYTLFLRNRFNWAIPGLKVDQLREFVLGQKTFLQLLAADPDFAPLATALGNPLISTFNQGNHFNVTEMNTQITSDAERLVFFIGGNDVRGVYQSIYEGNPVGSFVDDFMADATAILDHVRSKNPNIQLLVVAVPHIGITPDIKSTCPTDPVKTPRVTDMLQDLNARLEALAKQKGGGFADIFTPTLSLLDSGSYGIHGIPFANSGTATGDLDYLWLNGEFSANFHPNTNAQLVIANEIIRGFNKRYQTGIAPLSATEMLGNVLGKSAVQIDMTFANWMTGFGLSGQGENSDADGDGIKAGAEFALGLNPTLSDADQIASARVSGGSQLELAYPKRLPSSTRFTLQATSSTGLAAPFTPIAPAPTIGSDGLYRARIPVTPGGRGFLRLESTLAP